MRHERSAGDDALEHLRVGPPVVVGRIVDLEHAGDPDRGERPGMDRTLQLEPLAGLESHRLGDLPAHGDRDGRSVDRHLIRPHAGDDGGMVGETLRVGEHGEIAAIAPRLVRERIRIRRGEPVDPAADRPEGPLERRRGRCVGRIGLIRPDP